MFDNHLRNLFQHHTARLDGLIAQAEDIKKRYSNVRLIVFVGSILAAWAVGNYISSLAGWVILTVGMAIFAVVVVLHRRVYQFQDQISLSKEITLQLLARLTLDWDHIPKPAAPVEEPRNPQALDLDLTGPRSLHHLLDCAISRPGSQLLADWLLAQQPPSREKIISRQAIVRELSYLTGYRTHLLRIFRTMGAESLDDQQLLAWLAEPYPAQRMASAFPIATVLVFANLTLFLMTVLQSWPPFWVISTLIYALFYITNLGVLNTFLDAVVRLDEEIGKLGNALHFIEAYPYRKDSHLAKLCAPYLDANEKPSKRIRQLKWATTAAGLRMNPVLGLLLNIVTPWDFWAARKAAQARETIAQVLPTWLETFHELETYISLGTFAALYPNYQMPEILPAKSDLILSVQAMGHPLLAVESKISNDFSIEDLGQVMLITGSNMAGKSTFIRTVGVNLSLAQAGGPVNAQNWQSQRMRLYTCIRISDSLGDGFSYFYAEVKRLKGLLDALKEPETAPLLYLVDEIFRGTNNRERLIGSRAFVRALVDSQDGKAPAGVGLIATHDLELAGLADDSPRIHNYHFRDEVSDGKLTFDYRIRRGPSPTTNALKIMALEGLPVDDPTPLA